MGLVLKAGVRVMWDADSDLVLISGEKNHLGNDGLDVKVILKWILNTVSKCGLHASGSEYSSVLRCYIRGKRICSWIAEWHLAAEEPEFNYSRTTFASV